LITSDASLGLSPGTIITQDNNVQLGCNPQGVEISLLLSGLAFEHSFLSGPLAKRARQPGQAIVKACNNKQRNIHRVLDLTGGWGVDGFTLACHGQQVTMLEHHPLVYSVLAYSLERFEQQHRDFSSLHIEQVNASDYLSTPDITGTFDCIYLDPMFAAHKSSAKPAKEMQILQAITDNLDIESVFERALQVASRRVVVKRSLKALALGGQKPDMVYREKTIRFDVYLTR
jgi:16S rRNA (guanine1516-N2)-methyltransferase